MKAPFWDILIKIKRRQNMGRRNRMNPSKAPQEIQTNNIGQDLWDKQQTKNIYYEITTMIGTRKKYIFDHDTQEGEYAQ